MTKWIDKTPALAGHVVRRTGRRPRASCNSLRRRQPLRQAPRHRSPSVGKIRPPTDTIPARTSKSTTLKASTSAIATTTRKMSNRNSRLDSVSATPHFAYSDLKLNKIEFAGNNPQWSYTINVRNTGTRAGAEVVQLYVHDGHAKIDRPAHELKAFSRVELKPGETKTVSSIWIAPRFRTGTQKPNHGQPIPAHSKSRSDHPRVTSACAHRSNSNSSLSAHASRAPHKRTAKTTKAAENSAAFVVSRSMLRYRCGS